MATATMRKRAEKTETGGAAAVKVASRASRDLKQISDPGRCSIALLLLEGEKHVGDIWGALGLTAPATSHSLGMMKIGGLVQARRDGQRTFYALTERGRFLAGLARSVGEGGN